MLTFDRLAGVREDTISTTIETLVIAGWAGRDEAAIKHHIEELAAVGVPPPSSVPVFYRVSAANLTQSSRLVVLGPDSSGEVEPVLVALADGLWVGVGSDHTDRKAETIGIALSKQLCGKPVGTGKPGPITHRMQELFFGLFDGRTEDRFGWLEPVNADGRETAVYRAANTQESEYQVLPAEIVHFRGADGTELAGRLIKPAAFEAGKKYPVVVNVYGGPDVALPVRNAWPGVGLDQVLAQRGYVVWQADNRGGAGRGHAFETVIAHQLGVNELADQIAGVRYLISLGFADPARIGIRGWSYGGFMTVNALLRAPDLFRAGFAGAPVTDWLNYDTIYTERYMGLPQDNQQAYEETALTRDAARLTGKLLLVHNFEDDNVLFQNTLQLVNALQQAGKQFEFMLYPQKAHNVGGKAATQMNELALEFFDRSLK